VQCCGRRARPEQGPWTVCGYKRANLACTDVLIERSYRLLTSRQIPNESAGLDIAGLHEVGNSGSWCHRPAIRATPRANKLGLREFWVQGKGKSHTISSAGERTRFSSIVDSRKRAPTHQYPLLISGQISCFAITFSPFHRLSHRLSCKGRC